MPSSTYPPQLPAPELTQLLTTASTYALSHGLVLAPPTYSDTSAIHAPYSLFPTPFPRELFQQALALQPLYNALYAHVTADDHFLDETVGGKVSKVDEFQRGLYEIWFKVRDEGIKQPLHLGLFRSDYLVHSPPGSSASEASLKQVEFNTISSSFGALASRVTELHRFLQKSGAYPIVEELSSLESLPPNAALVGLAAGLAAGHKAFGDSTAKILFVIQDNERNVFDQRLLEYELLETHNIQVLRVPFSILHLHATLSPTSTLLVSSPSSPTTLPSPISVVYFRSGYTPTDFPTPTQWSTRLLLERSTAIKCPTIALQLSGCKKVQQVLAERGVLEKFVHVGGTSSKLVDPTPVGSLSSEMGAQLEESWTRLYSLDGSTEEGRKAYEMALSTPAKFVLKPQREGGGNNVYREAIPPFLKALEEKDKLKKEGEPLEREAFILMDLIEPPRGREGVMVRAGEAEEQRDEVVSELGVYGVVLFRNRTQQEGGEGAEILLNETVGHLLRTKGSRSDEGGVAVGFSVIDSPVLV